MYLSDSIPGRKALCDGKELLFFSGTAYLGMNSNPQFQHYLLEGMSRYGTNYSSSRSSNFSLKVFEEAEHHLAMYTGAQATLTVSSGYMAAQLTIQSFKGQGDFIFAPNTHPALWTSPEDFFYADFNDWINRLPEIIQQKDGKELYIVTNSLDPLFAKQYNFDWISTLPQEKSITLIIDDSHGLGITGNDGAGIYSQLKMSSNIKLVVVSSLGKAMGIPGGVILSNRAIIGLLRKSPFFGTSSPVAPAYLYAYLYCDELYRQRRKLLFANINHFIGLVGDTGLFQYFENYPVFYTRYNELYPFLMDKDILVSSFAYPLPGDDPVTRVIINSCHQFEDVEFLAGCIKGYAGTHRKINM